MKTLLAFAFALVALPALAAELAPNEMLDWSGEDGAEQVFTAGDLTMTLKLSGDESEKTATLTVEKPGAAPVEVSGSGAGTGYGQVGVVDFDSNGQRSVLFAVYAGGAHCCMQTTAVTETAGGWVTAEVGAFDGDSVHPEDIDGDGTFEIASRDDRFNYAFDAYAFSYPPPAFLKSRDGEVYDASAEPGSAGVQPCWPTPNPIAAATPGSSAPVPASGRGGGSATRRRRPRSSPRSRQEDLGLGRIHGLRRYRMQQDQDLYRLPHRHRDLAQELGLPAGVTPAPALTMLEFQWVSARFH